MPQDTVKTFKTDRGFGFIKPDEGGNDVFVHASELERIGLSSLTEGQRVSFDIEADKRSGRPRAVNVRVEQ